MFARRVTYRGHVQGVGFRVTAQHLAEGLSIAGQVRNLPDGGVELVVEGEPDDVSGLLQRIAERMKGYIADTVIEEIPVTGAKGFRIAY